MSREAVETLMDRWVNEPAFRAALRSDPEAAIRRIGIELDEEEMTAFGKIDWGLPEEELQARVSRGM